MLQFYSKPMHILPNEDNKEFHGTLRDAVAEVQEGFPFLSHSTDDNPETHRKDHQTEDVRLARLSLGGFICDGLCKKGLHVFRYLLCDILIQILNFVDTVILR